MAEYAITKLEKTIKVCNKQPSIGTFDEKIGWDIFKIFVHVNVDFD